MSQANVDLVRDIYALWAEDKSARRGTLAKVREIYPDFHVEPERFVDAGENVAVIGVARGTSHGGIEAQWRQGYVWTVRDGRAARFRWFNDPKEALEAVGLAQ